MVNRLVVGLAITVVVVLWLLLVVLGLWLLVSLVILYGIPGVRVVVAVVATLLLTWLKIIRMSLRKRVVLDCDLYLSFVHVGAAAYSNPVYEV